MSFAGFFVSEHWHASDESVSYLLEILFPFCVSIYNSHFNRKSYKVNQKKVNFFEKKVFFSEKLAK
jgi:hypothetical protein